MEKRPKKPSLNIKAINNETSGFNFFDSFYHSNNFKESEDPRNRWTLMSDNFYSTIFFLGIFYCSAARDVLSRILPSLYRFSYNKYKKEQMTIGIDISQLAYSKTGVSNYLYNLVLKLIEIDKKNEYVLFFSSLRRDIKDQILKIKNTNQKVKIKQFKIPPLLLDFMWNKLHIAPIEWFIGDIDIFITSDWAEPPSKRAKKATILYDLIVYKYPDETAKKIVNVQKRKLKWAGKESNKIFCISKSTAEDAIEILGIERNKLEVIYPGL